jgi:hypothetical protein
MKIRKSPLVLVFRSVAAQQLKRARPLYFDEMRRLPSPMIRQALPLLVVIVVLISSPDSWLSCCSRSSGCFCQAGEPEFNVLIGQMERNVLEFAQLIQFYHAERCPKNQSRGLLRDCNATNYHELLSILPGQECITEKDMEGWKLDVCTAVPGGSGGGSSSSLCAGVLWDYTTSAVRLPLSEVKDPITYHPKSHVAIETICYSAYMDQYLRSQRFSGRSSSYWAQAYFGSATGANRIYPGRTSATAGVYDPRRRPWYIAAASGPKNVIVIIDDTAANAADDDDLIIIEQIKTLAHRTISNLTVADSFAVVAISATKTSSKRIYNEENDLYDLNLTKHELLREIDAFQTTTATTTTTTKMTIADAFAKAFGILDEAKGKGRCAATAILFLTPGGSPSDNDTDRTQR